ncbi:MAG: hypothetical protein D3907_09055, partial [Candidatus Electrothrix sp. AUS3]|nr:hypothetical protein [Candidatus Electrothrix gigas]
MILSESKRVPLLFFYNTTSPRLRWDNTTRKPHENYTKAIRKPLDTRSFHINKPVVQQVTPNYSLLISFFTYARSTNGRSLSSIKKKAK